MSKQEYVEIVERLFRTIVTEYNQRYRDDKNPEVLLDMLEKNTQAFMALARTKVD